MDETLSSDSDRPLRPLLGPIQPSNPPQTDNGQAHTIEPSWTAPEPHAIGRAHTFAIEGTGPATGRASLAVPGTEPYNGPPVRHTSEPIYHSPLRHHRRQVSSTRRVKETLNARSEHDSSGDEGCGYHRINQYAIQQEIGRGSFGAVHYAVDQFGNEFAVKEFSKSRLRRRKQSNMLRRPRDPHQVGGGFNAPLRRAQKGNPNSLDLIREEVAVMKKLNHSNLVSLIEVLDVPEEDSLYMVMEMCKKGVVMKVGLDEIADPYDPETCRCWFRDMILGIEYLHAQGVIHRDIKPDNCLIDKDDVLKIVDFGVSEMFEKDREMKTSKSAGSPAFMPPELCVAKHGEVSGQAADIWSMGVTLYCLRYGRIPFEKKGIFEMYKAIREDPVDLGDESDEDFRDLMSRILEKDPTKRITMDELRSHPWVTKRGEDPLLPKEENVAAMIEDPTEAELNAAITGSMRHLLTVMKAARHFKKLLFRRRPELVEGIFGRASRIVQPPLSMDAAERSRSSLSIDVKSNTAEEPAPPTKRKHHDIGIAPTASLRPHATTTENNATGSREDASGASTLSSAGTKDPELDMEAPLTPAQTDEGTQVEPERATAQSNMLYSPQPERPYGKGQAHDLLEHFLFLNIGVGPHYDGHHADDLTSSSSVPNTSTAQPPHSGHILIVSETPPPTPLNVYEEAYRDEVTRILQERRERQPTLYLTRRVEGSERIRGDEELAKTLVREDVGMGRSSLIETLGNRKGGSVGVAGGGIAGMMEQVKKKMPEDEQAGNVKGVVKLSDLEDTVMRDVQP